MLLVMDYPEYRELTKQIPIGKNLPDSIYVHESCFGQLPEILAVLALETIDRYKIKDNSWNIIKFFKKDFKIAYLNYPGFEEDSYPQLKQSQLVDLQKQSLRKSDYSKTDNAPILHRKETFVSESYPLRGLFEEITAEGEAIGLYQHTNSIELKKIGKNSLNRKAFSWMKMAGCNQYQSNPYLKLKPQISMAKSNVIALLSIAINYHSLCKRWQNITILMATTASWITVVAKATMLGS